MNSQNVVFEYDDILSSFKSDLNDFVTKVEMVRSGITVNAAQNYVYDKRNQLTSATRPMGAGAETFTYDSAGNRLQRDGETTDSTFDDVNRLLNDKKFTYEYDNNGNMIKKASIATGEVTEFDWDYRDRLVGVLIWLGENGTPTLTISYKYDAFNRRIEKNVNGTFTRYVYDRGNIVLEYDGENTFQAKYVHTDNVDEAVRMERPVNPYRNGKFPVQEFYYHRDRLGNITEITDFEGTVVQRYVYNAFGKVSIFDKDGNAITPNSANYLKSPYAFTGREYDHETGMYFYRARYYDPDSGRFISEDPIGLAGLDENLYRYVGNNSVNFVDPEGLFTFGTGIAVGGDSFGNAGRIDIQLVADDQGNINIAVTRCYGGTTEATGYSVGLVNSAGTGETINELEGGSALFGVGGSGIGPVSPVLGASVNISDEMPGSCSSKKTRRVYTGSVFHGTNFGGVSPIEITGARCETELLLPNNFNLVF